MTKSFSPFIVAAVADMREAYDAYVRSHMLDRGYADLQRRFHVTNARAMSVTQEHGVQMGSPEMLLAVREEIDQRRALAKKQRQQARKSQRADKQFRVLGATLAFA